MIRKHMWRASLALVALGGVMHGAAFAQSARYAYKELRDGAKPTTADEKTARFAVLTPQ